MMFKIGEFSKLTQVSIRMLRYYDEAGLLKPAAIDRFTSYRLYDAGQITDLNKIVFLRDLGFNVSEIAAALAKWEDDFIEARLEEKRSEIERTIAAEQKKLAGIELAKRDFRQQKIAVNYNVSIKSVPSYRVLSLRRVVPDYYAEGLLWKEMSEFAVKNNLHISSDTFAIYHDGEFKEADVDIEICAPTAEPPRVRALEHKFAKRGGGLNTQGFTFRETEAVPDMAYTMVYGSFENIAGAFISFAGWLQKHNQYRMGGHSRQIVHRGPWNEESPDKYLTEIQIPLIKI